ncbi:hypothetical protein [Planosporangium thailandense]|nr:hypothetical protein [Planosporangium thailandense]
MTAVGVAAGAGAAQFGLVYGLGIVTWQPVRNGADNSLWLANLTWSLWIAATSTVLGAVYANGSGTRRLPATAASRSTVDLVMRIATALAAAIGALVTVPLVVLPARAALRADTFRPEVTAGAYAVVGVLAGLVAALIAVNVRVIAANVVASTAWVWLLAAVAVADAVRAHRTAGTAQLAAWQFLDKGWFHDVLHIPGAFLMLGVALLIGVFSALPADRRGDNRFGIAVSGAVGPLLVAAAYLLSAPKPTVRMDDTAYGFSAYAVIAGLAGSVFVAVLAPLRPRRRVTPPTPDRDAATSARGAASPAREAVPAPGVVGPTADDDSDLTQWTSALAGDAPGYGLPASPPATAGAGRATPGMHGVPQPATGRATASMDGVPQTATGWATVAEPVSPTVTRWAWSDVPQPRQTRDFSDPATS